jgi:hypothetical protein
VADVLRDHAGGLSLSAEQARAVRALVACRTAALGGHLEVCGECGYSRPAYNSCRNRHCPKCQVLKQVLWAEAQECKLLPVGYFHVVFTIPAVLHPLFRRAARTSLDLLFEAVSETLLEVAQRKLGARIGFSALLHTWTQKLLFHPHLHCIVPGGGLSGDGSKWIACGERFLLPVRVLRVVFRGKLLSKLERALVEQRIPVPIEAGRRLLRQAARLTWVVYAKRPLAGPEQVVRYVSRYTHRIAISNSRLLDYDGEVLCFRWRDRKDANRCEVLRLRAEDFARRFLWHVLPRGFVRIRHYGLLSNRTRKRDLRHCRSLLGAAQVAEPKAHPHEDWSSTYERIFGEDPLLCPSCGQRRLSPQRVLAPLGSCPPDPRPRSPP